MSRGGARAGAGKPKGRIATVSAKARAEAAATGLLPHEWLLMVARGEPIKQRRLQISVDKKGKEVSREWIEEEIYPDFPTRVDAAKAAAPFYAPKLAVQVVSPTGTNNSDKVAEALKTIAEQLPV